MTESMVYNQTDCWKGLQDGDPQALGFLYDNYADKLFEAALWVTDNRELCKDALQDVFVDIWNYRASLGNITHTQGYLVKVLHRIIFRKLKAQAHISGSVPEEVMSFQECNVEETIIMQDTERMNANRLRRACTRLTQKQQTVIKMRFYEGLSYKQIAERLRMNYQSVNNLMFRTLLHIRKDF